LVSDGGRPIKSGPQRSLPDQGGLHNSASTDTQQQLRQPHCLRRNTSKHHYTSNGFSIKAIEAYAVQDRSTEPLPNQVISLSLSIPLAGVSTTPPARPLRCRLAICTRAIKSVHPTRPRSVYQLEVSTREIRWLRWRRNACVRIMAGLKTRIFALQYCRGNGADDRE